MSAALGKLERLERRQQRLAKIIFVVFLVEMVAIIFNEQHVFDIVLGAIAPLTIWLYMTGRDIDLEKKAVAP